MAQLRCTNITFCCSGATSFSVDGANGRLLEVTDDLSCSIFSANTIAGLPVIEAFANNCVSMGQFGGHKFEVTSNSIRGGKCTTASGYQSFVGGGYGHIACNSYSTIVGGDGNYATSAFAFVGGGYGNGAYGYVSFIGGGNSNSAGGCNAVVAGGSNNSATATYSSIVGGKGNTASGYYSFVGGGSCNSITSVNSSCSTIVGGFGNSISTAVYSSILGGFSNTVLGTTPAGLNIHIIGSCILGQANNYTYVNNLCQTGGGISDCRVKNTIQPLEFGLDHITKLQPVSFCWNGDTSCHKKYGFIAQNVQQAMSCVVTCNPLHKLGNDGTQVLNGEEGEPLLEYEKDAVYASYVNAFKDLKAENDALKYRIEAIENILKANNLL